MYVAYSTPWTNETLYDYTVAVAFGPITTLPVT